MDIKILIKLIVEGNKYLNIDKGLLNDLFEDEEEVKKFQNWLNSSTQYLSRNKKIINEYKLVTIKKEKLKKYELAEITLDYLYRLAEYNELNTIDEYIWGVIEREIENVSRVLYIEEHYSEAVFQAVKLLSSFIRDDLTGIEKIDDIDGSKLMHEVFTPKNPIVKFTRMKTKEDKGVQLGYMELFSGVMLAIRNPKAHRIIEVDSNEAVHLLLLIDYLFKKYKKARDLEINTFDLRVKLQENIMTLDEILSKMEIDSESRLIKLIEYTKIQNIPDDVYDGYYEYLNKEGFSDRQIIMLFELGIVTTEFNHDDNEDVTIVSFLLTEKGKRIYEELTSRDRKKSDGWF